MDRRLIIIRAVETEKVKIEPPGYIKDDRICRMFPPSQYQFNSFILWGHSTTDKEFVVLEGTKRWLDKRSGLAGYMPVFRKVWVCIEKDGFNKKHCEVFSCDSCRGNMEV